MSASLKKKGLTLVSRSDIVFCNAGDDVVLPCHLQPAISAGSMEIKWLKRAELICHFKDGDVTESIDDMYKGKVNLSPSDLHNGNVSLTLKDVRAEHRGIYICEVIHEHQTVKEYIFLHVRSEKLTLVASPTIIAELGENKILPAFLSPVTSAVSMEIEWCRENKVIYLYKYGQETVFENQVDLSDQQLENGNLSITLRNVQQSDLGEYTCKISYDGNEEMAKINLRMKDSLHRHKNSMEITPPVMRNESLLEVGRNRYGSTNLRPFYDSLQRNRNSMERTPPLMRNENLLELGRNRYGSTNLRTFYAEGESSLENDEIEQAGARNLDLVKRRQNNEGSLKREVTPFPATLSRLSTSEMCIPAAKMTQPQKTPGSTMHIFQEGRQEHTEQEISPVAVESEESLKKKSSVKLSPEAEVAAENQTHERRESKKNRKKLKHKNCQQM